MSAESYIYVEVDGDNRKRLTFRRADTPGAVVEVTLNGEKTNVQPSALLLAMKTILQEEIE